MTVEYVKFVMLFAVLYVGFNLLNERAMMMNYQKQYEKSIKEGTAKEMVSEIKTEWAEGEVIVGKLINITVVHFEETGNDINGYVLETDSGLIQFTMGASVDMQAGDKMVIGNVYACMYKGKKDIGKGRHMNVFKVLDCGEGVNE